VRYRPYSTNRTAPDPDRAGPGPRRTRTAPDPYRAGPGPRRTPTAPDPDRYHPLSGRRQMSRSCISSICLAMTSRRYSSLVYGARSRYRFFG